MTDIPDSITDDNWEDAVTSIMKDIHVIIQNVDIKACHRIGKSCKTSSSKRNCLIC